MIKNLFLITLLFKDNAILEKRRFIEKKNRFLFNLLNNVHMKWFQFTLSEVHVHTLTVNEGRNPKKDENSSDRHVR